MKVEGYRARYRAKYPERCLDSRRGSHLRRSYGLTEAEYQRRLKAQGGCCAICGKTEQESRRRLAVDHKHGTTPAFVRGVLCHSCNVAIGNARESVEILKAIIRYLKKWDRLHRRQNAGD